MKKQDLIRQKELENELQKILLKKREEDRLKRIKELESESKRLVGNCFLKKYENSFVVTKINSSKLKEYFNFYNVTTIDFDPRFRVCIKEISTPSGSIFLKYEKISSSQFDEIKNQAETIIQGNVLKYEEILKTI